MASISYLFSNFVWLFLELHFLAGILGHHHHYTLQKNKTALLVSKLSAQENLVMKNKTDFNVSNLNSSKLVLNGFASIKLTPTTTTTEQILDSNNESLFVEIQSSLGLNLNSNGNNDNSNNNNATIDKRKIRRKFRLRHVRKPPPPRISPEDFQVREFWGGSCLGADWDLCKIMKRLRGRYWDGTDPDKPVLYDKSRTVDCSLLKPYWCLKNGWTVTDCQIICMAKCNRLVLKDFENFLAHPGQCPLIF